jgi:formylglycine-generating enzyme required for sulfatase activity
VSVRPVLVLGSALVATCLAIGAQPLAEARSDARGPHESSDDPGLAPAERAITGGVVALKSPGSRMIKLRASSFRMGSEVGDVLEAVAECAKEPLGERCREEMFSDELPRHVVRLSAYWLDRTEVTVKDYRRCVALHRCKAVPYREGAKRFDRPSYPVSLVTFSDAEDFCRFRGARLPTEAEFERAARGQKGRRYPWGELYNSHVANHGRLGLDPSDDSDGYAELAPVGSFPDGRTPEGFLDLAGNVAEWIADFYAPGYPDGPASDPHGPSLGGNVSGHVVRGGHFSAAAPWLRGAARSSADAATRSPTLGFRCARSDGPVRR